MQTQTKYLPAWVDRFSLGVHGRCPGFFRAKLSALRDALARVEELGVRITTPRSKSYDGYEQLTLRLLTDDEMFAGELRAELHVRKDGSDLVLGDRSAVSGNGLIMMRGILGNADCGPLSFESKGNVLGVQHRKLDPLEHQLPRLVEAFEYARDALVTAFPGLLLNEIWLKRAEACRDLSVGDAVEAVRIIEHSTLRGAVKRIGDLYPRVRHLEEGGIPSIRYTQHSNGPEEKIYAKREADVRLEIACRDRRAVAELAGRKRATSSADAVAELFRTFLTAAAPRLDMLEEHVRAALEGEVSGARLIVALKPIIDRAAGETKGKGPTSAKASVLALRYLDALLSTGMCDASCSHARHAIRRDLDAMCTEGGPLIRHPRRLVYYLKPAFARACAAIKMPAYASVHS